MRLKLSRQAEKFLQRIPTNHAAQIAVKTKMVLREPDLVPTVELKGHEPYCGIKSGEYRVIFKIESDLLFITLIGKRNDDEIYKRIKRFLK